MLILRALSKLSYILTKMWKIKFWKPYKSMFVYPNYFWAIAEMYKNLSKIQILLFEELLNSSKVEI